MRLTCIAGLGGLPQVSIPIGTVDGCPVGLSFIAWPGGDEALLDLAVRLARYLRADVRAGGERGPPRHHRQHLQGASADCQNQYNQMK